MPAENKPFHLFVGPFQPDLEEAFLDWIRRKKNADPFAPVVVLVGSNLLGLYLQRLLAQKGFHHINIRFITFLDLAKALADESLYEQKLRPLPPFGELVAILSVTEKIDDNSYFSPIADLRGFQKGLAATFRDLWDGGIEAIPLPSGNKLTELTHLYHHFRELIGKESYNDSALLFRASQEAQNFSKIFACSELIIYGFYDFTESQKQLVKACADQVAVAAFMPFRDSPAFHYASSILQWYKRMGFQIKTPERSFKQIHCSLELLQQNLFREGQQGSKASTDGAVKILSAPNEEQEIREIAREILRLAREENIPLHEMAILLRNADLYRPLILETFQRLQIPFYLQGGIPLLFTQLGKSILLLLDLVGSNLKRPEVMQFLTFAPIAWLHFFGEEPSPAHWDLVSREAGIIEGKKQWEEKLTLWINQIGKLDSNEESGLSWAQGVEGFRFFINTFFPALDQIPQTGSWKKISSALKNFLNKIFADDETLQAIFDVLTELESLDFLRPKMDIHQFKNILSEAMEAKSLPLGLFQKSGVCISDLMPARGLSFQVVFIPGLVERSFPAPVRQDPLLLDHERKTLNDSMNGKGGIPLKRSRYLEEQMLFSLAVGSAQKNMFLSYPRLDSSSGRERIPSFFLLRVGEALNDGPIDYRQLEALPFYHRLPLSRLAPDDSGQAIDEEEFDLSQVRNALKNKDPQQVAYLKRISPCFERSGKLAYLRWGLRAFTEYDGCLISKQARQYLHERFALSGQTLSPTQLELYASCPFQYFLSEILRLRILPTPEEIRRIQPVDRGKVVHEILYRFYTRVKKDFPGPLHANNLEAYWRILSTCANQVFTEAEAQGLTGLPMIWELDRQELLEDLHGFLEKETEEGEGMIPTFFEIRFGYPKSGKSGFHQTQAISLALEDGSILSFRGRIDRVDFSPDQSYLGVIDYKTGNVQGNEDGFCGGTTLQLPIYLMSACQIWSPASLEKSRAEYYSLKRGRNYPRLLFRGEDWGEKEKVLKKIMHTISSGIASGIFFPYARDGRDCGYCDFGRLCEHGVESLFERKKKDPRAALFLEMKEIP
jgi:ATP-dependent helicase/nuclease subunit B